MKQEEIKGLFDASEEMITDDEQQQIMVLMQQMESLNKDLSILNLQVENTQLKFAALDRQIRDTYKRGSEDVLYDPVSKKVVRGTSAYISQLKEEMSGNNE